VGVTKWCTEVAPVSDLPKFGDCWHMESVEDILRLKPALVIGSVPYKQETVGRLLEQPLNFLAMNPRTLADLYADIRILGGITGRTKAAERLVGKMQQRFAAMERQPKKLKRRLRVYCEAWPNPRISSPPWVGELVRLCGGEMVLPAGQKVTDDQVAAGMPDVIVLAWTATGDKANVSRAYEVEAWKEIPAIRNGRVYVVRDEWLNTPGPPLVQGAKELFRLLHLKSKEKDNAEAQRTQRLAER
jgi:iron complex transport system substrate-binding protein